MILLDSFLFEIFKDAVFAVLFDDGLAIEFVRRGEHAVFRSPRIGEERRIVVDGSGTGEKDCARDDFVRSEFAFFTGGLEGSEDFFVDVFVL